MRQVPKMNIKDFAKKKLQQEKISMVTCYDYPSARILAETDIDCALVGDSVVMVVHGHTNATMATLPMMEMHTQAVSKGLGRQLLITDLPFLVSRMSKEEVVKQVRILLQAGAQAIKIEGGDPYTCEMIAFLVEAGIPILGHIGLMGQYVLQFGGHRVQGREEIQAKRILAQAKALEEAGCSALVVEGMPEALGKAITAQSAIATIGIGAGRYTDGQVLVWHDVLDLQREITPRFVKRYLPAKELFIEALQSFAKEIKNQHFPQEEHCY